MSGTDILTTHQERGQPLRRTPVVVLTTTDDKVEIQRCYDLGCNVYITKPVNYESFADAIRQLGLFLSVIQVPDLPEAIDGGRPFHRRLHPLYRRRRRPAPAGAARARAARL